jgi:ATP-dependent DNA helicase RecG
MPIRLQDSVRALPGIGPARAKALERLGILSAGDLLHFFPRGYEDRTLTSTIREAPASVPVCIPAMVAESPRTTRIRKGLEITKVKVADASSCMTVTFFNQSYVKDALRQGSDYIFFGKVEGEGGNRRMTNPEFEREDSSRFTGRILPVYPLTAGLSNHLVAGLARRVTDDCAGAVQEVLPGELRRTHHLAQAEFAYRNIHFPASWEELAVARRRLVFEELLCLTAGLAGLKRRRDLSPGTVIEPRPMEPFYELLPFALTAAQKRVIGEAAADLGSGRPMNRLVQGDVGSGKTAVAAACAYLAAKAGHQAAMMAPTELLAQQHHCSLEAMLRPAGIRVGLLTGSMKASEKRKICAALAEGEIDFVVGTHALLSEGVSFASLGLVITDEQHRFGVDQRAALSAKGGEGKAPHVLVMSATPIPRTLALIIYGDLDVSVIDELPPGRRIVKTYLVGEDKRARMYGFVRKLAAEGRQTYIVCPAIEDEEGRAEAGGPELKAVTEYAETLKIEVLPDLRVGFVHGRMKAKEKNEVMGQFVQGALDVLVSTTVIEVGLDVPNAALMIVENAERYGLSQLHQLRGRVGRGRHQSYCVLMTASQSEDSLERLMVLVATGDGFKIAEEDLKLRGPGDFFGARQHGLPQLKVADLAGDMRLLVEAQEAAGSCWTGTRR